MAPRRPTSAEWQKLVGVFPKLTKDNVWITGEPTSVYNCIAFSLGITNKWINPPQPLSAFQELYQDPPYNHPVVVTGGATAGIDGWATPAIGPEIKSMTHGSKKSTVKTGLWESKLGKSFRITHGRNELVSSVYGRVVTSFK